MNIHIERVPGWFIDRYRRVHEPPAPHRPRLGMSELEAQEAVRPPRRLIVGSRRTGDFWDRRIDERMAEKRFIEFPRKH